VFTSQTHRMAATVPKVELSYHRNADGIGCPNGKTYPVNAVQILRMRTQFFIGANMGTFRQQPNIQLLQQGTETIGIINNMNVVAPAHFELIAKEFFAPWQQADEKTAIVIAAQFSHPTLFLGVNHPNLRGVR